MKGKKIQIGSYVRLTKDKIYFPAMEEILGGASSRFTFPKVIKSGSVGIILYDIGNGMWKIRFYGFQQIQSEYGKYLIEVEEKEAVIAAL